MTSGKKEPRVFRNRSRLFLTAHPTISMPAMLARNIRLCLLHGSGAVQEQTSLMGLTSLAAFPREPLHRSVAPLAESLCAFQP
jgi:hypothetical protein